LASPKALQKKTNRFFRRRWLVRQPTCSLVISRSLAPYMNQPENTFGLCIQNIAEFLNQLR
jgi:hypothetical protein